MDVWKSATRMSGVECVEFLIGDLVMQLLHADSWDFLFLVLLLLLYLLFLMLLMWLGWHMSDVVEMKTVSLIVMFDPLKSIVIDLDMLE